MSSHAILSASSSQRWTKCPASALLQTKFEDTPSEYAMEGTSAHELCEYKVSKYVLGKEEPDIRENLTYYNQEMEEMTEEYLFFVQDIVSKYKSPLVLVEQRLDFSSYVPDGFGTGDLVVIADDEIHIVDFKYGLGVLVDATDNPQMKLYALGAIEQFGNLYDIDNIKMTIFQPRRQNISTFETTVKDLYDWAEDILKPIAKLAYEGQGNFKAGSHCKFCKANSTCRERAEYNLQLAKDDFTLPPLLEDTEIEQLLPKLDDLISWANEVKDYALKEAISGKKWQGYKLVEGRSNRKYKDENEVADIVIKAGFKPYEEKLLGITEMTKMLGKNKFDELLKEQIIKPKGKPALVEITDKRKEINLISEDFKEKK